MLDAVDRRVCERGSEAGMGQDGAQLGEGGLR